MKGTGFILSICPPVRIGVLGGGGGEDAVG